nr:thiamine pyrophosphate-dependent enzyme [Saprospiraceae bacterium]
YADCDNDPFSGGRQMNNHFATDTYDSEGNWLDLKDLLNISSDISCTGGQVARAIGHAFASKVFRSLDEPTLNHLSNNGNEVCFLTIGEGSTSEGAFWEMMNAAGVLDIPLVAVVYDDGYSISVPVELQTTKSSISKAMEGLLIDENGKGIHIYVAKAWDYQELCMVFQKAADIARRDHKAVLIHVQECTQPQGHSTSGSHERYKTESRLDWESEFDCILKMEEWIMANAILSQEEIEEIGASAKQIVKDGIKQAWSMYENPIKEQWVKLATILDSFPDQVKVIDQIKEASLEIKKLHNPFYSDLHSIARRVLHFLRTKGLQNQELSDFVMERSIKADMAYHSKLHSETPKAALTQIPVHPIYDEKPALKTGYQIINAFFDHAFEKRKDLIAFGEDLGLIGDVNQGFAGLQEKYGDKRIMDTGIREWTIIGQALGASMRGIKPVVE